MSAYLIFDVDIWDMTKYQEFMANVKPAIEAAGGKYLVRGGAHKVYEGDWQPRRIVLFEFPSMQVTFPYGQTCPYTQPASGHYWRLAPLRNADALRSLNVIAEND